MNVEIGTEAPIFIFWEYLFQIFGILSLQCMKEIAGGGEKRRCRQSIFDHRPALGNRVVGRGDVNPPNPYQNGFVIFAKINFAEMRKRKNLSTLFYLWLFPIGISLWLEGKAKSVHMVTSLIQY
jgi:hypothetical protein